MYSSCPTPMISGLPLRATTSVSGSSLQMTAMPYVPSTSCSAACTARCSSDVPGGMWFCAFDLGVEVADQHRQHFGVGLAGERVALLGRGTASGRRSFR